MEFNQAEKDYTIREINNRGKLDWDATIGHQRPSRPVPWSLVENQRKNNTHFLKQLVQKYGWPKKSDFGSEAIHWAWYIAQHSDLDVEFQKRCLELMENLPEGEKDLYDLAHLVDRVRLNQGKVQLYGTQVRRDSTGGVAPMPTEKPEGLIQRRKEMGLDVPFEIHHNMMIGASTH